MLIHIWLLPIAILVTTTVLAFPLSRFLAWIMDGKYKPLPIFRWAEDRLHSGPQNWKQYTASILIFNTVLFIFGFAVLALQPWMPLNPDGKDMLAPSTILAQRSIFYDQHGPAALFRRSAFVDLQSNFLWAGKFLSLGLYRVLRLDCHYPGIAQRFIGWKLSSRHVACCDVYVPPDRFSFRDCLPAARIADDVRELVSCFAA